MTRNTIKGLSILVTAILVYFLKISYDAGEWTTLKPSSNFQCQKIEGLSGPEDIVIDHQTKIAYISAGDWRNHDQENRPSGAIFSYDLNSNPATLQRRTVDLPFAFHPHGLDFFQDSDGSKYLMVINHRPERDFVEIFSIPDRGNLNHLESIQGDLMHSPNDLAAIGPRQFYVTNDHGNSSALGKMFEEYLQLANAYLLLYDGKQFSIVAKDFSYANGVAVANEGRKVLVTTTTGQQLKVFDRDIHNHSLKLVKTLSLDSGADNIDIAPDQSVWIASHPKLLTFVKHSKDASVLSPSQVLRFDAHDFDHFTQPYLNLGEEISGSSVAASYQNRVLIGAVFEPFFLDCLIKE